MHLGTLAIHDPRLDTIRTLPITKLEFRNGQLYVEAEAVIKVAGAVREDDILTIQDPDGRTVLRTWLDSGGRVYDLNAGERFTLMVPISLGGARPLVTGDSTININL